MNIAYKPELLALATLLLIATSPLGCGSSDGVGGVDLAVDQPVGCSSDAQCSDGRFCNGLEVCDVGNPDANALGCVGAEPPCDVSLCDESTSLCSPPCADLDEDGHRDVACGGDDCDDNDGNRFPGNTEVCDSSHDEDCDVNTFGTLDFDGDRFTDARCCNEVDSVRVCGLDCDDSLPGVNPVVPEVCSTPEDDNCNGQVNETCGCTVPDAARPCGMDGPGRCVLGTQTCTAGAWTNCSGVLAADEDYLCDNQDEDCDGTVDEGLRIVCVRDLDEDGAGNQTNPDPRTECPDAQRMGAPTYGCSEGRTRYDVGDPYDCCDSDSRAYPRTPGVDDYFVERNNCGSWDYDCNGSTRMEYPVPAVSSGCTGGLGGCRCTSGCSPGWGFGDVAECGETQDFWDGCRLEANSCGTYSFEVQQRCR